MAIFQDIEVKITLRPTENLDSHPPYTLPIGEPLKEYHDPKPRFEAHSYWIAKYVESVPDREWQLEVYFKPTFDMFDASDILVDLSIDHGTMDLSRIFNKREVLYRVATGTPLIIRDVYELSDAGEDCRLGLAFGSLQGGE